ncbi:PhzF family phenazine biosynthesis isomerase [Domibacillus indicus]|uniref:PhzF family phenazine biosynthesis protein n=1 Tax=Domibacillus indicus TaxID=1437523 RepID=UPI00203C16D0|nr:PhzF family phenazine biosynthesis isomerase [Domibacillus indicus]MCM3791464.1 PhzF family phenazine biosynthesis isomerase [Domibacillus indicus]
MKLYNVNTFTEQAFSGNPAAVCILQEEKDDKWLQQAAKETNLPVTAFVHKTQSSSYMLWWFTPTTEIPICGHGTLASAYVLWKKGY